MQRLQSQSAKFKDREMRFIALEITKGLHYLHHTASVQIIHRDLKSKNILVDINPEGEIHDVKLCDFGVSKMLTRDARAETMVGTYYWMAPEILAGDGDRYGVKADIWSLGMVFVELTTLHNPYYENGTDWARTKRMILAGKPPHVDQMASSKVKHLITYCLRLQPEQRPATREIMMFLTE